MNIQKLAAAVGGTIEGNSGLDITRMSGLESARAGDMVFAVDEDRLVAAEKSGASCILTHLAARASAKTLIRVKDPKLAFLVLYNVLAKAKDHTPFTHPSAAVARSARVGSGVKIGAHVAVGEETTIGDNVTIEPNCSIAANCMVGPGCHLYPSVTLYEGTILKDNVILHSGVVIGADGFGYVKSQGEVMKFPQLGKVIIEENVEIGANTTIDRGSLSDTIIGAGTKIDNLCQIAHNVKIGRNCLMAAQCGVSGSTVIENDVTIGGQVGITDNATIGAGTIVAAKSGIIGNIEKGQVIWGIPARPIAQTKRQMAALSWLAKNFHAVSKLLKQ